MVDRLSIIHQLFLFLWQQKLWWLLPVIMTLVLVGSLMVMVSSSPLAPFIYPLF